MCCESRKSGYVAIKLKDKSLDVSWLAEWMLRFQEKFIPFTNHHKNHLSTLPTPTQPTNQI
jgi:hypothetical protein